MVAKKKNYNLWSDSNPPVPIHMDSSIPVNTHTHVCIYIYIYICLSYIHTYTHIVKGKCLKLWPTLETRSLEGTLGVHVEEALGAVGLFCVFSPGQSCLALAHGWNRCPQVWLLFQFPASPIFRGVFFDGVSTKLGPQKDRVLKEKNISCIHFLDIPINRARRPRVLATHGRDHVLHCLGACHGLQWLRSSSSGARRALCSPVFG